MTNGRNTRARNSGNHRSRARVEGSIVSKVEHHDYLVGRAKQHGQSPLMAMTTTRSRFPMKALEMLHSGFKDIAGNEDGVFTVNSFGHDYRITLGPEIDGAHDIVVLGDQLTQQALELLDGAVPTTVLSAEREDYLPDLQALFLLFEPKEEVYKYLAGRALASRVLKLAALIEPLPNYPAEAVSAHLDVDSNMHFPSILTLLEDDSPEAVAKIFDFAERTSGLVRLGFEDHIVTSAVPTNVPVLSSTEASTTETENDMTQKTETAAQITEDTVAAAAGRTERRTAATDPIVAVAEGEVITVGADDDFNGAIITAAKVGAVVVGLAVLTYAGYKIYTKLRTEEARDELPGDLYGY